MKKWLLTVVIILSIIALGFVVGLILPNLGASCTKMACSCKDLFTREAIPDGERPCNGCQFSDPVFTIGILHINQRCSASEIITCENGEQVSERIDVDNKRCNLDWYVFGYNLKYLTSDPSKPVSSQIQNN